MLTRQVKTESPTTAEKKAPTGEKKASPLAAPTRQPVWAQAMNGVPTALTTAPGERATAPATHIQEIQAEPIAEQINRNGSLGRGP